MQKSGIWIIYNKKTGSITKTLQTDVRTAILNIEPGEWCIPGHTLHLGEAYVKNRKIIKIPPKLKKETYSELRQEAILDEWSITQQMEAITEAALGRPEKLNLLREHIESVKKLYPKG